MNIYGFCANVTLYSILHTKKDFLSKTIYFLCLCWKKRGDNCTEWQKGRRAKNKQGSGSSWEEEECFSLLQTKILAHISNAYIRNNTLCAWLWVQLMLHNNIEAVYKCFCIFIYKIVWLTVQSGISCLYFYKVQSKNNVKIVFMYVLFCLYVIFMYSISFSF